MYEPLRAASLTRVLALSKSSFLRYHIRSVRLEERKIDVLPDLAGLGVDGVDDATALRHDEYVKAQCSGVCTKGCRSSSKLQFTADVLGGGCRWRCVVDIQKSSDGP